MVTLTVEISEAKHRALQELAAKTGKSISELVDERLPAGDADEIRDAALDVLRRARKHASMDEDEASEYAVQLVREYRRSKRA